MENWLYSEGAHTTKNFYDEKIKLLETKSNCFYSRFNKIHNMQIFLQEATPATENYLL